MKSWRRSVVALLLGALAAGGYFYAESVRQKNRADLAQVRAEQAEKTALALAKEAETARLAAQASAAAEKAANAISRGGKTG